MTQQNGSAPTLDDVAVLEDRAGEIQQRLDEIHEELSEITETLAHFRAEGEPERGQELREERHALQDEKEELETALPILEDRIVRERNEAFTAQAEAEISTLKRRIGGVHGEFHQDVERASRLVTELDPIMMRILSAHHRQDWLKVQISALAARFGLSIPELRMLPTMKDLPDASVLPHRIRHTLENDAPKLSQIARTGTPLEKARDSEKVLADYWNVETTAVEILSEAGPSDSEIQADDEAERRKKEQQSRAEETLASVQGELATARAHPKSLPMT